MTRIGQPIRLPLQLPDSAGLSLKPREVELPRQRARLWELNGSVHCSVIGTCLTTGELRRVMGKLARADVSHLSDHDLHAEAVGRAGHLNTCAKLLHKALDTSHAVVIRQFGRLQGEAAVLAKWQECRRAGDIPGAYWAVLTHPDIGHAGIRQAFGDVHMLSHLVGAANRADIRRLAALEAENATLLAKIERQQARLQEAVTARDATIRRLQALAASQACPATNQSETEDAAVALRDLVTELQRRLVSETARREKLEQRCATAAESARRSERRAAAAEAEAAALQRELSLTAPPAPPDASLPRLAPERILYVGGRPGSLDQMRAAVAAAGGELLCHDGGRDDHPSLLPGLVSQADRVVFPVDCVSHDAARSVKRLCRRLDKAWLPLRSSGVASFLAAMATEAR